MAVNTNFLLQNIVPDLSGTAQDVSDLGQMIRNAPLLREQKQQAIDINEQNKILNEQNIATQDLQSGQDEASAVFNLIGDEELTEANYSQAIGLLQRQGFPLEEDDLVYSPDNARELSELRDAGKRQQPVAPTQKREKTAQEKADEAVIIQDAKDKATFNSPQAVRDRRIADEKAMRDKKVRDREERERLDIERQKSAENQRILTSINQFSDTTNDQGQVIKKGIDLDLAFGQEEAFVVERLRGQKSKDARAKITQVVSSLKLANASKLKGSGSISDGERALLGEAATVLSDWTISPELAAEEMAKIKPIFEKINREAASEDEISGLLTKYGN